MVDGGNRGKTRGGGRKREGIEGTGGGAGNEVGIGGKGTRWGGVRKGARVVGMDGVWRGGRDGMIGWGGDEETRGGVGIRD